MLLCVGLNSHLGWACTATATLFGLMNSPKLAAVEDDSPGWHFVFVLLHAYELYACKECSFLFVPGGLH